MANIKIASAQYPITEQSSFAAWQAHTEKWVSRAVHNHAGLLLFPEYGSMELVSIFEEDVRNDIHAQVRAMNGLKDDFCRTFSDLSSKFGVVIVAPSLPVLHNDRPVNRAFAFSPGGASGYQDKFFMTRFEDEEWHVTGGEKILTLFETAWGSFGIQICYDVEFPVGSALLAAAGADLILAPSCTETIRGATRVHVGARARAMENQLYTVVSQTVGDAPWSPAVDINYGFAAFYSTADKNLPEEGILALGAPQNQEWLYAEPDFSLSKMVRENGQVFNFRDMGRFNRFTESDRIEVRKVRLT